MAYCKHCGARIDDGANVCLMSRTTPNSTPQTTKDDGGFLWGLLGCCIPIVGLVLFLVWRDTKPKTSKAAGIGALVSVIVYVLFYVFAAVVGVGVAMY